MAGAGAGAGAGAAYRCGCLALWRCALNLGARPWQIWCVGAGVAVSQ